MDCARKRVVSEAEQTCLMDDTELRQFALLQLEMLAQENDNPRIWAALYAVQALDHGPVPIDFGQVINQARKLDDHV